MRALLKENFFTIKNMMIPYYMELAIAQTFNYETSIEAHNILEHLVYKYIDRVSVPHYGLGLKQETVLKISNIKRYEWLL
jgi:hypothetical protein